MGTLLKVPLSSRVLSADSMHIEECALKFHCLSSRYSTFLEAKEVGIIKREPIGSLRSLVQF